MFSDAVNTLPLHFAAIEAASKKLGFSMPSDLQTGALLQTLAASKPKGNLLEIGTGTGLATAWLLAGMDVDSTLISIDSDATYQAIAQQQLGHDNRLQLVYEDAGAWLEAAIPNAFDLIFADAWPGKYANLNETLNLLKPGGIYIIDDMLPQPNWPSGHGDKVTALVSHLESREDVRIVKLSWSTGVLIATKE